MNLVDSSAWLEYFADGPNTRHFAPVVKTTGELVVPTVALYEVFKVVLRERGDSGDIGSEAESCKGKAL